MGTFVMGTAAALLAFVALRFALAAAPTPSRVGARSPLHPGLPVLASNWEPELYAELGSLGPAKFDEMLRSPCVHTGKGVRRCVPGAYLIGNWQSNAKGLGAALAAHPDVANVGNDKCFGTGWTTDQGGRRWLRQPLPESFDPQQKLLVAMGCVTMLTYYPVLISPCPTRDL